MPKPGSRYERSARFDFRQVRVDGGFGYAVYFLESDIDDGKHGPQKKRWLESAIVRRERGAWRVAVLHSTRIAAAG
jgi:ketosteroid isomerase-like protein